MKRLIIAISLFIPLLLLGWAHKSLESGIRPGEPLPDAQLQSLEGAPVDTSWWHGKPTLLVLFQPACRACREEIRNLEWIAERLPEVRIILLSLNGAPPIEKVRFMVCRDPENAFSRRVRRAIVPTLYWIDPSGRVKYVRSGLRPRASDLSLFRSLIE
ncbi:MAG TPA: TlpA disulfide reductase family protein [Acidobacteriota bacterium]|nr:TlpA disulfide reductase family protein [Acidobacteriota bacterium]